LVNDDQLVPPAHPVQEATVRFAPLKLTELAVVSVILPFCVIVNLGSPDDEAVNKSPTPELSTTREAKDVLPEIEATGKVPVFTRRSSVARGDVLLLPIAVFPLASINKRV